MFDVQKIRADFPILSREVYGRPLVYLDNAATTLHKPASVSRAAERAICSLASPGRGGYPAAMAAAETAFACREAAAELFQTYGTRFAAKALELFA